MKRKCEESTCKKLGKYRTTGRRYWCAEHHPLRLPESDQMTARPRRSPSTRKVRHTTVRKLKLGGRRSYVCSVNRPICQTCPDRADGKPVEKLGMRKVKDRYDETIDVNVCDVCWAYYVGLVEFPDDWSLA